MPDQPKPFYLTTPIYYVNARPHIGHAYSTIVADVLARRHRLLGDDTYFLTGTDEHGQKIERAAAAAGIPPQQYAHQVSKTFSDLWARMGITHDQFIRTTDPKHIAGVQKLFTDLYANGQIYLSSYTGQYSVGEEMFVEGPPGTLGPDGRPTETVTEENFFFRLSDFQLPLLNLIESNQLLITPDSSRNEVLAFLRGDVNEAVIRGIDGGRPIGLNEIMAINAIERGFIEQSASGALFVPGALRDLSISRSSFTWGIPVPEDIQRKENAKEKHVIYVWLDALANYMTALGYGSVKADGSPDDALWQKFWPADIHLVGKEITRFHCVYWPAFLLALNPALKHAPDEPMPVLSPEEHAAWAEKWLPKQVTANGWLLFDNSKMSKSKGNVVRTETILDAFGDEVYGKQFPDSTKADRDLFAADILRYYLLREIPFGQDGSFSFDSLITRYNADLANGYGNLVSRTLTMIQNFRASEIPNASKKPSQNPIVDDIPDTIWAFSRFLEINDFFRAIELVSGLIGQADGELSSKAPWILAKKDDEESQKQLSEVLYDAAESIRIITALLHPILPYATARVWTQLGLDPAELTTYNLERTTLQWGGLKPGTRIGPLSPIFPRADKGLAQIMTDMEENQLQTPKSQPQTDSQTQPRPETPLKSATTPAPVEPIPADPTHPAAPPRAFSSLDEPAGTLSVAGSTAHTTHSGPTPSHTEAQASGIFAQQSSLTPLSPAPSVSSPEITIDDFAKIDLRVAQIVVCERIPKADKLLRLEVDLGPLGKRQILSGIAEFYTPEELIGRRIVVITNLAPRKMRGLESHGMLLAASDPSAGEHGRPALASCGDDIPLGSRLK